MTAAAMYEEVADLAPRETLLALAARADGGEAADFFEMAVTWESRSGACAIRSPLSASRRGLPSRRSVHSTKPRPIRAGATPRFARPNRFPPNSAPGFPGLPIYPTPVRSAFLLRAVARGFIQS